MGRESKQVTHSKVNAGFPAWHPDGKTIIYRVWGTADSPETRGLRALDLPSGKITVLTTRMGQLPIHLSFRGSGGVHAPHARLRFRGLHA